MEKKDLVDFLKENLKIEMKYDGSFLTVKLTLNGEMISEATEYIYRTSGYYYEV
jgi:hypothetical protein